jgi:hypothetical protein
MLLHEEQSGRFLRRLKQDYPAATVAEFRTAVLNRQVAEFQIRAAVLNGFTALGIPVTEAVG